MIERVQLAGFSPDSVENNPSILISSNAVYPTVRGMRALSLLEMKSTAPAITYAGATASVPVGVKYPQIVGNYNAQWINGTSTLFAANEKTTSDGLSPVVINGAIWKKTSSGNFVPVFYINGTGSTTSPILATQANDQLPGDAGTDPLNQTFDLEYNQYISMDQFGDYVFVAAGGEPLLLKNDNTISTTSFLGIKQATNVFSPRFVARSGNFVILACGSAGTDTAGLNMDPTYWRCSIDGVFTGADPDFQVDDGTLGNSCVSNNLRETPGPIIGMKALDRSVVIYKENSVYLLSYVGPPVVWSQFVLSHEAGAVSNNAVVDIGGKHIFWGQNDFYAVQGNSVATVPTGLRDFLFGPDGDLDKPRRYGVSGIYDQEKMCVFWYYPSVEYAALQVEKLKGKPICDKWVCWNISTNTWSQGTGIEASIASDRLDKLYLDQPTYPHLTPGDALTYLDFGLTNNPLNPNSGSGIEWGTQFGSTTTFTDTAISGTTKISAGYFTNVARFYSGGNTGFENVPVFRDSLADTPAGGSAYAPICESSSTFYAEILKKLYGEPATLLPGSTAEIRTGDFGDGISYKFIRGIRPVFSGKFTVDRIYCTVYAREKLDTEWREITSSGSTAPGNSAATTFTRTDAPYWINVRSNARYHQFKISFTGLGEITGLDIDYVEMGNR